MPGAQIEAARLKAAETGGAVDEAEDACRRQVEEEGDNNNDVMSTIMSREELHSTRQAQGGDLPGTLAPGVAKRLTGKPTFARAVAPVALGRLVKIPPTTPVAAGTGEIKRPRTRYEQQKNVTPDRRQEISALSHKKNKKTPRRQQPKALRDAQGAASVAASTAGGGVAGKSPPTPPAHVAADHPAHGSTAIPSGDPDSSRQGHGGHAMVSRRLHSCSVRGRVGREHGAE